MRASRRIIPAFVLWLVLIGISPAQAAAHGGKEFPIPTIDAAPYGITAGPDGNIWFTEYANKIGRITVGGSITEFPIPTPSSFPPGITAGPDGNLWFTEQDGNKIG